MPNVFNDIELPQLILRQEALRANVALMAHYCADRNLLLAPHAKTSMLMEVISLQLEAGAWGFTAATVKQARTLLTGGVERVLIANIVADREAIAWIGEQLALADGADLYCYVDSVASVGLLEEGLSQFGVHRNLKVLLEVGYQGGRTGARGREEMQRVVRSIQASARLRLSGVAAYEGLLPMHGTRPPPHVRSFLTEVREVASRLEDGGAFSELDAPPIVTAGGSSYFDVVADELAPSRFDLQVQTVLRSGCYAFHDHGLYERTSPFGARRRPGAPQFVPALELAAVVLSRPEPELAIAGFGRREAPFDDRLPTVLGIRTGQTTRAVPGVEVVGLNDHHAHLRIPADVDIAPGDLLVIGMSHPCGALDRWRDIAVVDHAYDLTDMVHPRL